MHKRSEKRGSEETRSRAGSVKWDGIPGNRTGRADVGSPPVTGRVTREAVGILSRHVVEVSLDTGKFEIMLHMATQGRGASTLATLPYRSMQ